MTTIGRSISSFSRVITPPALALPSAPLLTVTLNSPCGMPGKKKLPSLPVVPIRESPLPSGKETERLTSQAASGARVPTA